MTGSSADRSKSQEEFNHVKLLSGIRVIAIEQFGAAPYGTMFLADLVAEVIKIENCTIGGDPARQTGPYRLGEGDSEYFESWNLNKKSVALDLKSGDGRTALHHLTADADAVVNSLRGDLPVKLGLDYASLAKLKPSIVCLHISAYGRDNERAAWPSYDYLMQAEARLMHLTGQPEGPPERLGAPVDDRPRHRLDRDGWSAFGADQRAGYRRWLRCRCESARRRVARAGLHRRVVPERRTRLHASTSQRAFFRCTGANPDAA